MTSIASQTSVNEAGSGESPIRIGLSPLPASFTEVWDAMEVIRTLSAAAH